MGYKSDDVDLLLPAFAVKVKHVLSEMKAIGHDPVPFDTLRTQAEADKFFARGVGSKNSMHMYGVACDIICNKHGWECKRKKCKFFEDLGKVVEGLGLVWGGRFKKRYDLPHFQGCTVADQDMVRKLPWEERNRYIAERLCK